MVRIKRYIEVRGDGTSTGRTLYYVTGELPASAEGCSWKVDHNFKIEEDTTHDPEKLRFYGAALIDGFTIVEA